MKGTKEMDSRNRCSWACPARRRASPYIIGIDEVGRGALAGPVVAAAALVPMSFRASIQ